MARRLSIREVARRIKVSPSLISQIELGKAQPSVSTLWALAGVLGVTVVDLFSESAAGEGEPLPAPRSSGVDPIAPVVSRFGDRTGIDFGHGLREDISGWSMPGVHFWEFWLEPGTDSLPNGTSQRHSGYEWGYAVSGTLSVRVGFDDYDLGPGDAIAFSSGTPHRWYNKAAEPARGVGLVIWLDAQTTKELDRILSANIQAQH